MRQRVSRPGLGNRHGSNQLRTKDAVRSGTKFFARYGLAAQHWEATSVAVVENLHQLGFLIGEAEVAFVDDQRTAHGVEDSE